MFDWCISGRAESVLHTVSNPFQEIWISALRPREMVTCCCVTNSSFSWHCDAVRVNTTGSDSTQQTLPNTGGAFDWWERGAVCFFEWTLFTCEPWLVSEMFQKPFKSMRLFIYATIFINSRRKAPDVNISPDKLFHCKSHVYWRCIRIQCLNTALVNTEHHQNIFCLFFLWEKLPRKIWVVFGRGLRATHVVPGWWPLSVTPGLELMQSDVLP